MRLLRKTTRSVRYYSIAVYPTLFDDYLLLHHCGPDCSDKSTKAYFKTKKEALLQSLNIISEKQKNGFKIPQPSQIA